MRVVHSCNSCFFSELSNRNLQNVIPLTGQGKLHRKLKFFSQKIRCIFTVTSGRNVSGFLEIMLAAVKISDITNEHFKQCHLNSDSIISKIKLFVILSILIFFNYI